MITYLLATDIVRLKDASIRIDENVCRYEPAEMVELFTDAQRAALAAGKCITRCGITYVDMVLAARLVRG